MNGMEQFFEQANFADNIKVRYVKLKLREDNIDDDILVVENPPATPKPNVDIDVHASTSVALTCVQENESIEEQ
ncbi:hypothetical protein SO802_034439 [Lithocarpus litseifolius]|uniref:Uncharacterized protein n=1 Tax=Lithocarpus litseifolius TaxID=425828 RepID=A0AAW2BIW6_9ROSI